jgi:hypothetical protein
MNLKDQMLKAGLVSKQDAKRAAHEQRVQGKHEGAEERERREQARREEREREARERREADQRLAEQRKAGQQEREQALAAQARRAAQLEAALREGRMSDWEGNRAFHFADGARVEQLSVNDEAARRLEDGRAAIVRSGDPLRPYTLLAAGAARKLAEVAPERVVVLHA